MTQSAVQHMKNRRLNSEAYNELWEGTQSSPVGLHSKGTLLTRSGPGLIFNVNPRLIVYEGV